MAKEIQMCVCIFLVFGFTVFYELSLEPRCFFTCKPVAKRCLAPKDVLTKGRNIMFLETTDRLHSSPLALCSLESAARIYSNRSIVFFLKGLDNHAKVDFKSSCPVLSSISSMKNVYVFPLQQNILFQNTPLQKWYLQHKASQEKYWVYISSDASRLALVWKYGGIYMDTDVISISSIPVTNFVAIESSQYFSSGVLGFHQYHKFLWDCMEDFVKNYNADIWGHQGPHLITRVVKRLCNITNYDDVVDQRCHKISFLHRHRFYPIGYTEWKKYYEVWNPIPEFKQSYALHLWNFMNKEHKNMTVGSNTLVENLFKTYCPITYKSLLPVPQGKIHNTSNSLQ